MKKILSRSDTGEAHYARPTSSTAHSSCGRARMESHQYEPDQSEVWWHHQLQRHFEDKGRWWTFARKSEFLRWTLTLLAGGICGAAAFLVTFFTGSLSSFKFRTFYSLLEQEKSGDVPYGTAFLFLFITCLLFAFVGWSMVYIEPLAAGSGIPEVKVYLNGLDMPRLMWIRTLLCKGVGIIFAVASGLPLGKEGPMVLVGSIVAAELSQGNSFLFRSYSKYQDFRNDREKRDFVACGAAAGVAAAFQAPIGGVLFSLEEGSSFWSTKLTWRCFFCAMMTVLTLYFLTSAQYVFGQKRTTAMFSFGEFFSLEREQSNYSVWELGLFLIVGSMGGFVGAVFNSINISLFEMRKRTTHKHNITKLLEVLLINALMTSFALSLPLLWKECTPLPLNMNGWSNQEKELVLELVPLYCDKGTHYNEVASLFLTDSDTAIRQLFHFRETDNDLMPTFSSAALALFWIPYTTMACLAYGIAIPMGLFAPSLLSGAAFGRLIGHLLHLIDNASGTFADSGTYALMGAAAILGGVSRMTISLTVIVLEATGDMQYVVPLMLTVMAARLVGNIFNDGLYDLYIHGKKMPFLDEEETLSSTVGMCDLCVADLMTHVPTCMAPVMRVGDVYEILQHNRHFCFPVACDSEEYVLRGTIMRKVLCTLMKHRAFGPSSLDASSAVRLSPLVNWGTLECVYPNYPDIEDIRILTEEEKDSWLDLRPYLDTSPYTVNEFASLERTYRMFRTLGLRHLIVTDVHNRVQGIVTRSDLVGAHVLGSSDSESKRRRQRKRLRKQEYLQHTIDIDSSRAAEMGKELEMVSVSIA